MNKEQQTNTRTGLEIAVIGMAGRFPGAKNIDEFWNNLKEGKETLSFFSDEELEDLEKRSDMVKHPYYVPSKGGVLEGQEYFDARFFDYTPLEAEIMDPQIRIFHECCWEALEDAGYASDSYRGGIGLYAGNSTNLEWEGGILLSGKNRDLGEFAAQQLTVRDFLTTRVSYKLNLRGPSLLIQTACSTSLVAIHTACRALLTGECKMALAGGVTVSHHQGIGYVFQEGMISSPDGHCRAFDAEAKGTVFGSGVGVVVLKPLKEAIADRDHIYAVVKGSAVNNDGLRKVGYSAPSVKGQIEVIRTALRFSRVEPESITYVETHGTGTELGDPVEVEALTRAFNTKKRGVCGIGTVKTNVGHLDAAAGVAGFVKTVLALKNRLIPPSLHFKTPNPKIDFENSPFYVNSKLKEWKGGGYLLRAGVSSFGIGGTNAHVVLEEWPIGQGAERKAHSGEHLESPAGHLVEDAGSQGRGGVSPPFKSREYQLILLSAKTQPALDGITKKLGDYFKNNPHIKLADAAYTLQVGRKAFLRRRMLVCSDIKEAANCLASPGSEMVRTFESKGENCLAAFMFPGQGSQYINMGLQLYQGEPVFREAMDRCFEILRPIMGYDIKEILYPTHPPPSGRPSQEGSKLATRNPQPATSSKKINQTEIAQPLIFIIEYALAKLLMKWGIKPAAMIGHSIGEYTAACLAGVFSLEDALKMVALRGRLMQKPPTGAMLSVSLSGEDLKPLLNHDISLAAVNSPRHSVVSGPHQAVKEFETLLKKKGYQTRRLHTSHAFHSKMMDGILGEFGEQVSQIKLNKPQEPFLSNLTGQWIMHQQATDPAYWVKHLRHTVRFADGTREIIKKKISIFVEVGPGNGLSTLVRQSADKETGLLCVNLLRHPKEGAADDGYLLDKIGQLWLSGIKTDWAGFYSNEKRYRIPLPTYFFERQRFWIDEYLFKNGAVVLPGRSLVKKPGIKDWFYIPSWIRSPLPHADSNSKEMTVQTRWLVFMDQCGLGSRLVKRLEESGHEVTAVKAGSKFSEEKEGEFRVNPTVKNDYDSLLNQLSKKKKIPGKILHLWGVSGNERRQSIKKSGEAEVDIYLDRTLDMGIYSLVYLAQAIGNNQVEDDLEIEVVTDNMQDVTGEEWLCPGKAAVLGPVKVIPLEYSNIKCRSIDIILPGPPGPESPGSPRFDKLINQLFAEFTSQFTSQSPNPVIAYRGNHRWEQTFKPVQLEKSKEKTSPLREEGVYLVTGGLGGIGLEMGGYLVKTVRSRLILTGRSEFPGQERWAEWLDNHEKNDPVSRKIRKVQELEELGGKVLIVSADVTNLEQMKDVISQAEKQFGPINGVIHASGVPGGGMIQLQTKEAIESALAAKVRGTPALHRIFQDRQLDFFILCSSAGSILPGYGQMDYGAANAFLDAFASYTTAGKGKWATAINWGRWKNTGMAAAVESRHKEKEMAGDELGGGMTPQEALEAFNRILEKPLPRVVVMETDFTIMVEQFNTPDVPGTRELSPDREVKKKQTLSERLYHRPELSKEYAAPANETEEKMAELWQRFFGYEKVGVNDDFFELGGDSLKATMLISKVHQKLDAKIPLTEFFKQPTIKELTKYIKYQEKNRFTAIEKTPKKDFYPLSSAQKRLFIIQQKELHSTVYNLPQLVVLEKEADIPGIEQTIRKLIKRHESLRTSFEIVEGEPVQKIHEEVDFEIENHELATALISSFNRPFDLSQAPLMRVGLIHPPPLGHHHFSQEGNLGKNYILMVDMHHIISDEVSQDILIQNFKSLYEGKELPVLKLQYKDYSEWQNKIHRQQGGELKRQEEFWLKEFEGNIPLLNLPTDYPEPAEQSFETDTIKCKIGMEETKALKEMTIKESVTMFMLLLAIINVLLSKICGQEDIVIGSPSAGRDHADLEQVIGMFINFLALRNYPSQEKTFKEFLKEVKKRTVDAFENQDYQFENLVEKLKLKRDSNRTPLFDVVFSFHNIETLETGNQEPGSAGSEKEQEQANLRHRTAFYDLIFHGYETKENISLVFQYKKKRFKKETIENLITCFKGIVSPVIKYPGVKIPGIEMISENQKRRLIEKIRKASDKFFTGDARIRKGQNQDIKADFDF